MDYKTPSTKGKNLQEQQKTIPCSLHLTLLIFEAKRE
jgi:hypothetical protein